MENAAALAAESYRDLMEQVLAGRGLAGLTAKLARRAGGDAAVTDENLEPLQCFDGTGQVLSHDRCRLTPEIKNGVMFDFRRELGSEPSADRSLDPPMSEIATDEGHYLVSPVVLSGEIVGYVWVRLPATLRHPDAAARLIVGQAAAACAVEYLRERAMLEGEQRVRNSFLEDLLSGRVSSLSATRRRAKFLGYDLRGPQTVFVLDLDRFREFVAGNASDEADIQRTKRRFRTAVESWIEGTWKTRAMIWEHSDALVVLTAPGSDSARGDFINRVEGLRTHVQLRLGGPTVSAGIGLPVTNITRLPESFAQAEHAARIGWAIHGSGSTTDYAELGVYRLLFHLREQPELAGFCSQILGPLERYDREHSGQLVETVRMYLDLQGNVTRAADELHLHRNGLLYRLNRIQELAGISLDNPADRLSLQLALVAQPLLRKPPPERPLEIDRDWTAERETA